MGNKSCKSCLYSNKNNTDTIDIVSISKHSNFNSIINKNNNIGLFDKNINNGDFSDIEDNNHIKENIKFNEKFSNDYYTSINKINTYNYNKTNKINKYKINFNLNTKIKFKEKEHKQLENNNNNNNNQSSKVFNFNSQSSLNIESSNKSKLDCVATSKFCKNKNYSNLIANNTLIVLENSKTVNQYNNNINGKTLNDSYLERFFRRVISKTICIDDDKNYEPLLYDISLDDKQVDFVLSVLEKNNYINKQNINKEDFDNYCKNTIYAELQENSILCTREEDIKFFYIVESGMLVSFSDISKVTDLNSLNKLVVESIVDKNNKKYSSGDAIYFKNKEHYKNIVSVSKSNLICLNIKEVLDLIEFNSKSQLEKGKQLLNDISLFRNISKDKTELILNGLNLGLFNKDEIIHIDNSYLYIIYSGCVKEIIKKSKDANEVNISIEKNSINKNNNDIKKQLTISIKKGLNNNNDLTENNNCDTKFRKIATNININNQLENNSDTIIKNKGDFINFISFLFDIDVEFELSSISDVSYICISRKLLFETLGKDFDKIIIKNYFFNCLIQSQDKLLKILNIEQTYSAFKLKMYKNNQIVYNNANSTNKANNKKIIFIIYGVLMHSNSKEKVACTGDLYGTSFIDKDNSHTKLKYSNTNKFNTCSTQDFNNKGNIIANSSLICLEADWEKLLKSMPSMFSERISLYERVRILKKNTLLNILSDYKLALIAHNLDKKFIFPKCNIIKQDYKSDDNLYFIIDGTAFKYVDNKLTNVLERNSIFGECIFYINDNDSYDDKNENIPACNKKIGNDYNEVDNSNNVNNDSNIKYNIITNVVKKKSNLKNFNIKECDKYNNYSNILTKNKSKSNNKINKRCSTVISKTNLEVYIIKKCTLFDILDNNQIKYFQMKVVLYNNKIDLKDLMVEKYLGRGKFGKVYLVNNKTYNYAIKCITKESIDSIKLVDYIIKEKKIMISLDHPFVVKLAKTFQNERYLFFLMEYISGNTLKNFLVKRNINYENNIKKHNAADNGCYNSENNSNNSNNNKNYDVSNVLQQDNFYNIELTQFYAGILISVIEYLNLKGYVHRDIKPDNLMISDNGYLKLIDFGVAKKIKSFTSSIVGTPHYLAPEIILGEDYSYSVDYWSIGITIYEIFYGHYPFGNLAKSPKDIYDEVINSNLSLPYNPKFKIINSFLKRILVKDKYIRLNNFINIKHHMFFENFNFNSLLELAIDPPYKPINNTKMSDFICKNVYSVNSNAENTEYNKNEKLEQYLNNKYDNSDNCHKSKINSNIISEELNKIFMNEF